MTNSSGCRLTEAYQQDRANLDFATHRFKVLGKGQKERICIFSKDTARRIEKYLYTLKDDYEALFYNRLGNRIA